MKPFPGFGQGFISHCEQANVDESNSDWAIDLGRGIEVCGEELKVDPRSSRWIQYLAHRGTCPQFPPKSP